MISNGELISVAINVGVAVYFIHYYPRSLRKKLKHGRVPPLFQLLLKLLPPLGYLILILTAAYLLLAPR